MDITDLERTLRKVVILQGDRKHSGSCLKCGAELLEPFNDYHCCTKCTEHIEECQDHTAFNKAAFHDKGEKMPVKPGRVVVQSADILRQVIPMGAPTRK